MVSKQELDKYLISIKESDNSHECTVKSADEDRKNIIHLIDLKEKKYVR